jgi:hypothetical protein
MRKFRQLGVLMGIATMLVFVVLVGPAGAVSEAIICHATGSESNPFEIIVTDNQGVIDGHSKHEGDIIATNPTQDQIDEAKSLKGGPGEEIEEFCLSLGPPQPSPSESPTATVGTTTPPTTQAPTGFSPLPYAAAAVLLLGLGGSLMVVSRRRRV